MEKMPEKKDDILKKLIRPELMEKPSADFTNNIMTKLGIEPAKSSITYKPVITKPGWLLISLVVFAIYMFLFVQSSADSGGIAGEQTALMLHQFENTMTTIFSGSVILYISLATVAVFFLVLGESFFRYSRLKPINI